MITSFEKSIKLAINNGLTQQDMIDAVSRVFALEHTDSGYGGKLL